MSDSGSLQNRIALVTGGASGMGEASARELARRGARVIVVDRDGERAATVCTSLGVASPLVGDVADSAFCRSAVDAALQAHGRLDILVNCAGVILRRDAATTDDEQWARVMAVNVNGVFYMSRAALAPMRKQRSGAIVNFGSIWGSVGAAGVLAYCASKGAVHQITRAMALDHADDNIRINAVCPGEVDTPMLASGRKRRPSDAELQALAEATVPMKRLAQPQEIAKVVAFLASQDASYMTGALVNVDAGYTAR